MYIYESHMGGLYVSYDELDYKDTYCEQCGDCDWLLGYAETKEEAWNLFKDDVDIDGSGGWDYDYIQNFINTYWSNDEEEVRVYTDIWDNFQFRAPTYIDGHFEPYKFDLVKWEDHKPYEVTDLVTGEKKMSTRNCFTIGTLTWDKKEHDFDFESCGLRYLEHRIDGLEKFILDFCETMRTQLDNDE